MVNIHHILCFKQFDPWINCGVNQTENKSKLSIMSGISDMLDLKGLDVHWVYNPGRISELLFKSNQIISDDGLWAVWALIMVQIHHSTHT